MMTNALVAILALAAMLASSAGATSITSGGSYYTGALSGTSVGVVAITISSGLGTIGCNDSSMAASVTSANPAPSVTGSLTSATFSNAGGACVNNVGQPCTWTAQNLPYGMSVTYDSSHVRGRDASVTFTGSPYAGWKIDCSGYVCYYGDASITIDAFNANNSSATGGPYPYAVTIANLALTRQSGSNLALCSATATWQEKRRWATSPGGADIVFGP